VGRLLVPVSQHGPHLVRAVLALVQHAAAAARAPHLSPSEALSVVTQRALSVIKRGS
jgi:hypothetical protein